MNGFLEYISLSWDHVLELAIGHAIVVAIALVIDIVIGVSLGVLVYRRERAANIALAITAMMAPVPAVQGLSLRTPKGCRTLLMCSVTYKRNRLVWKSRCCHGCC